MFSLKNSEKKEDLEKILKNLGIDTKKAFRCLNPEHEDKNPSMRYDAKRQKVHCFSCGVDYDIYDVREILKKKSRFFQPLQASKTWADDWGGEFFQKQNNLENFVEGGDTVEIAGTKGEEYLLGRGFTKEIIAEMGIGYETETESIVIPYKGKNYRIKRSVKGKEYRKPKGVEEPLYEAGDSQSKLIYAVEGQLDAMSLIQAGVEYAIATGGSGISKVATTLQAQEVVPQVHRAVIVADNDEAGAKTATRLETELRKIGITVLQAKLPSEFKDVNEVLQKDEQMLKKLVEEWKEEALKLKVKGSDNMKDYMNEGFDDELLRFQKFKDRKTGFANIDEETSFYPGFYVLGAISSLGKTTFAHQLADQLSELGDKVLYFSLEQNRLEIASKGVARLTARANLKTAVSAIDIRRGVKTKSVVQAIADYAEVAKNENVIECGFETTIEDIVNYVERFIERTGSSPVVIVDYLQVVSPQDGNMGVREAVDANVKALKKLQSEHDIVVLVISSLNRVSYLSPMTFESFKESGGIEYTADVIWGLQFQVLNSSKFGGTQKEQRESIMKAKLRKPREIELVCLKNRYGRSSYKCSFSYYAEYDWFVPELDEDF